MLTQLEIEIMTARNMQNMKVRIRAFWGQFTKQGGVILPCMYSTIHAVKVKLLMIMIINCTNHSIRWVSENVLQKQKIAQLKTVQV